MVGRTFYGPTFFRLRFALAGAGGEEKRRFGNYRSVAKEGRREEGRNRDIDFSFPFLFRR